MLNLYRNCIADMRLFLLNFFEEINGKFKSVDELVKQLRPTEPVYCIRRKSQLSSKYFQNKFPEKFFTQLKLIQIQMY